MCQIYYFVTWKSYIIPGMNLTFINKVRRNHAIEHATVAVMAEQGLQGFIAGYATNNGFWLFSKAPKPEVKIATLNALERLYKGENSLSVSKNCGTNIALTVIMTDLLFQLYRRITKSKSPDLGPRILIAAASIAISNPLGLKIQQYFTTLSDVKQVRIVGVDTYKLGKMFLHKVHTTEKPS